MTSIVLGPVQIQALRVLAGSGINVTLGNSSATMTTDQLEYIIEEVQKSVLAGPNPRVGISLWDRVGTDTSNTAVEGQPGGNTVTIPIDATPRIVGQGFLPRHTWQSQGFIWIRAVMVLVDTGGGGNLAPDFTLTLRSRTDWDSSPATAANLRGKVGATTDHFVVTSGNASGTLPGSAPQRIRVDMLLEAEGRDSGGHLHSASGTWVTDNQLAPLRASHIPFGGYFATRFDPTEDKLLEMVMQCTAPSGTQTVYVASSRATFFHFRSGFGLD